MEHPRVEPVKNGWAAYGEGWAVKGRTPEEARERFAEAERRHKEIAERPEF